MIVRTGGRVVVEVVVILMDKKLSTKDLRHPASLYAHILPVIHSGRETNDLLFRSSSIFTPRTEKLGRINI